jgi:hypothetical protein
MKGMVFSMNSFTCPFCHKEIAKSLDTYKEYWITRDRIGMQSTPPSPGQLRISYYTCPNCKEISIILNLDCDPTIGTVNIRPKSLAKHFPEYVPISIRQDYEEAYSVLHLSPKASATLSRRCIQGMIHDKWNIKLKNLNQEISSLRDKIEPVLWTAIDSLRQLGNIGAHMEKDVNSIIDIDSNEAEKLLILVEVLIKEWYIVPYERNELLSRIIEINEQKQNLRKKTE